MSNRRTRNKPRRENDADQTEETSFTNEDKTLINRPRTRSRAARKTTNTDPENEEPSESKENGEEDELPKETSDENKKPHKKLRRRNVAKVEEPEEPAVDWNDPNILAVIIHQSDKLRTDINIHHPMVRVHIIDLDMDGNYVNKLDKERNVLSYYEKNNSKTTYIPPIMTTAFDFKANRSIIPKWEEIIVFNEKFNYFIQQKPNCLLMFEIIDPAKNQDTRILSQYTSQDTGLKWQRIAWGFLKLVGYNKVLNTEKKIRIQLYYNQSQYKNNSSDSIVPEIYSIYKNGPRLKYPASLHVTVKAILPPGSFEPGIRSLYTINQVRDDCSNSQSDLQDNDDMISNKDNLLSERGPLINNSNKNIQNGIWSRVAGLPCRVPNDLSLKLKSAKNGCYSIKFSSTGNFLACACVEDGNASPIYIYQIPTGKFYMKFVGHLGLIYEMNWSKNDRYLITASNDSISRLIDVENRAKEAIKILPHPNFLYTAKFHPNSSDIICTSGYDKVIRIWTINIKRRANQKYGQLLQELFGHVGYINSTCFSSDGSILYSADSNGNILSWNANSTQGKNFSEWTLKENIVIDEIQNQCINQIILHPNQFRMLVHLRDNEIKLIDLRLQAVIRRYKSTFNFTQNIKSAISPCGTFLFCSGADTKVYCWNIDTGDEVTKLNMNLDYLKPARDIDFHPYDNMISLCSFDTHSPIYVFYYNSDKATQDVNQSNYVNTMIRTGNRIGTLENDALFKLPNQTDDFENALQKRLTEFNDMQSKRWQNLQEKLDSVHPSQQNSSSKKTIGGNLAGQITLSMADNAKPEFKYKGPKEVEDIVIALYDYNAQRNDELDLMKGDELLVLVRENENWWMGELIENKKQGYFPANYVQDKFSFNQEYKGKRAPTNYVPLPKYSAKDVMNEFKKEFEPNNGLQSTGRAKRTNNRNQQPPESITSRMKPKVFEIHEENLKTTIKSESDGRKYHRQDIVREVNEVHEEPTHDYSPRRNLKVRDKSRRRAFAHTISGNPQTASEA